MTSQVPATSSPPPPTPLSPLAASYIPFTLIHRSHIHRHQIPSFITPPRQKIKHRHTASHTNRFSPLTLENEQVNQAMNHQNFEPKTFNTEYKLTKKKNQVPVSADEAALQYWIAAHPTCIVLPVDEVSLIMEPVDAAGKTEPSSTCE